ncbi:MAG: gliding motility lipoprotein GldD [Bacteroidales bacterium]|nr:gliding motility lipoprotein GldD [Bacteroidales bacterium]
MEKCHNIIKNQFRWIILIAVVILPLCKSEFTPKPMGYMRITLPDKIYTTFDTTYPYSFEYPVYGEIQPDKGANSEPYWINIAFPEFDGKIHISYKQVKDNLDEYLEDSRTLAYKHTIKADAIIETAISDSVRKVYGLVYEIKGNAASSAQFHLTDSNRHFLRGSLYFNVQPNADSLGPVIEFFKQDIKHLMETFEWKYE